MPAHTTPAAVLLDVFSCSPAEFAEVQSHWVQDTLRDYGEETTKMLALYSKQVAPVAQNKR